jgi:hypothetical protein
VTADSRVRVDTPIALFFVANAPVLREEAEYGPIVKHAVLAALLGLDDANSLQVQTWWGSLMLPVFRLAEAGTDGTVRLDQDMFLIWSTATRLVHDGDAQWTRPAPAMPWLLGTGDRIYLGVLAGLTDGQQQAMHAALSAYDWYLGMMRADVTDPLHHRVFDFVAGWRYDRGHVTDRPDGLSPAEVFRGLPVTFTPHPHSGRPQAIRWRLATTLTKEYPATSQEMLARLVADYTDAERPLLLAVDRRLPVVEEMEGKLRGYALNPDHEGGGPKAVFFRTALGLEQQDWRLLAVQLLSAVAGTRPEKFRDVTAHGDRQHLRFSITAPVLGLNGRTAMVTSGWKIEDDGPIQLVTLYPGKKDNLIEQDEALEAGDPAALHVIAAEVADAAQRACRPTPLAIGGGPDGVEVYPQGAVGFAWVHLPDHANPLAAWLIEHGHAHLDGDGDGVTLSAPTFDYEPAIAWADAFAAVLRAAGHDATVSHDID